MNGLVHLQTPAAQWLCNVNKLDFEMQEVVNLLHENGFDSGQKFNESQESKFKN